MFIFHHQFSTGQVVAATGVSNATLQTWLKRDVIVAQPPEAAEHELTITGGGKPGAHRRFSFFNVMEIALAKTLIDAGLRDLDNAFKAARHFAHSGCGPIENVRPARSPGCPFDTAGTSATTLLAVREDQSGEFLYKVGSDVLPLIWHRIGGRDGFLLIDAQVVFDRVVAALGFNPEEVLALAYGRRGPNQ